MTAIDDARTRLAVQRERIGATVRLAPITVVPAVLQRDGDVAAAGGAPANIEALVDIVTAAIGYSSELDVSAEFARRDPDGGVVTARVTVRSRR